MTAQRFDYLDSVRGIAAFCVLIFHLNGIVGEGALSIEQGVLYNTLFNGHHAVSIFFVLSGLVLSFKYLKMPDLALDYKQYILKRFYRLFPAYWVTLLLIYISKHQQHSFAKIQDVLDFIAEGSLFRNHFDIFLGGWSLNIEMGISLILPVLILVMRFNRQWFVYFTLFSVLLSAYYTLYLFHFCLGIWLAADFEQIQAGKYRNHFIYRYRYALLPIWLLFFSGNYITYQIENAEAFLMIRKLVGFDWYHASGIAAFLLLIWIIMSKKWQRLLSLKPLIFLGKISYSVYLMQWLVVIVWVNPHFEWFKNQFHTDWLGTRLLMATTAIGLTLVLATLLYYVIERPFIHMARKKFVSDK
jgi:peptidoglycan/LPS O-acetylase OafA/YrhL